jgi:hypothetical protein
MSVPDRIARLDRAHRSLSIRRQCQLLWGGAFERVPNGALANDNDLTPALDRGAVHNGAFPGLMTYVANAATRRSCRQSQAGPSGGCALWHRSYATEAANEHAGAGAPDIPISAARPAD